MPARLVIELARLVAELAGAVRMLPRFVVGLALLVNERVRPVNELAGLAIAQAWLVFAWRGRLSHSRAS